MSRTTKEINKITGTIIGVSGRLIIYALVILFLYEGIAQGYEFGYQIFHSTGVAEAPGIDKQVIINEDESLTEIAQALKGKGLIKNEYAFLIQCRFYEYGSTGEFEIKPGTFKLNNSMASKEIVLTLRDGPEEEEAKE